MSDRDPLELLSPEIGRSHQPDPEFAANLLDHLLGDLSDESPSARVGLRDAAGVDRSDTDVSADGPTVEVLQLLTPVEPPRQSSRWGTRLLRAAAIVLLIAGGLAALTQVANTDAPVATEDGEAPAVVSEVPTTTIDGEAQSAPNAVEQLAIDFLNARNSYDGAAMRQLVSDDASIFNDFGIATPDDYLLRSEYDRLINTRLSNIECASFDDEQASCLFTLNTDIGRHLRADGYQAELVVRVSDGTIVEAVAGEAGFLFGLDGGVFFNWLSIAHPEEAPILEDPLTQQVFATSESGAVIAARLPEFVEATPPPITTLLARDSRFTTLSEALNRTGVATAFLQCSGDDATLFALTNDAIDRYIESAGLERDLVLGDEAFFRSFVVEGTITLDDVRASDDQTVELTTSSGDTINVTGGEQPQVQGVPIVLETAATSTCNGTFHVIDDVYLSQ